MRSLWVQNQPRNRAFAYYTIRLWIFTRIGSLYSKTQYLEKAFSEYVCIYVAIVCVCAPLQNTIFVASLLIIHYYTFYDNIQKKMEYSGI